MRELAEVRRYWPRAKRYKSGNYSAVPNWRKWYACLFPCDDAWDISVGEVDGCTRCHHAPTIAEAMRAAGFGPRRLGEFARKATKRHEQQQRIIESGRCGPTWAAASARLLAYYQPQLADRQRPRKGVRLGKRKRMEVQP